MKKLHYFLGVLLPFCTIAQDQHSEIIPASQHSEAYYVVDNAANGYDLPTMGILVKEPRAVKIKIQKATDKFWVWISFIFTSASIIGLLLVFHKLKKNFNRQY